MIYRNKKVTLYRMQLRKEMLYRMIYVQAWANHLAIRTQALRNLHIQIEKLRRLTEKDEFDFLDRSVPWKRIDSFKHAETIVDKRDRLIKPQYKVVMSYVEKVFQDLAAHRGENTLTKAELQKRVRGFVNEVESYAREHAPAPKKGRGKIISVRGQGLGGDPRETRSPRLSRG